jgi:hypothetical protein
VRNLPILSPEFDTDGVAFLATSPAGDEGVVMEGEMIMRLLTAATILLLITCFLVGATVAMV